MDREEAINVVRCNWPEGRHQLSEALRTLIPELQESEDERIRREMIEYFHGCIQRNKKSGFRVEQIKGWIAYIERQKEYIDDIRQYAYNKGLVDAEEKQKPVNLDEDVELGLDRALQIIKDAKGNLCGYQSDDGIYECDHAIQTLERILKSGIDQKPAEWSDEDEQFLLVCKNALQKYQSSDKWDAAMIYNWLEKRLKSLRPQPHWKPSEKQIEALEWQVQNTSEGSWQRNETATLLKALKEIKL